MPKKKHSKKKLCIHGCLTDVTKKWLNWHHASGCWHPTDPKKLDGFFSETDFLGTPQYHILELLMQPTTEIHKMAEQLGPWSLLWKVSDAGPGNPKKPLRMLGNYSKKASVISLPLGCFIKLQISSQSSRSQRRPAYLSRPRDAAARETWRVTTTWSSATPDPQCARQSGRR